MANMYSYNHTYIYIYLCFLNINIYIYSFDPFYATSTPVKCTWTHHILSQKSSSYTLAEHHPQVRHILRSSRENGHAARDTGTSVGGARVAGGFFGSANFSLVVYGQSLPSAVRQKPAESLDETTTT